MTALKGPDIDRFMARPDPARPIVLVYGPDAGLVRERVEIIVKASVDDVRDPFALARLEGDELASEPTRLVEEANTIPLFGGRRAVWVKAGNRNFAPAVEALIGAPSPDCRVVIEAGDLKRSAPLRTIVERAKVAVALPCYVDNERDLTRLIEDELRAAGMTIAPDARAVLLPLLGGDRLASRNEIQKLTMYAHGKDKIELDDVTAVVADASALALDGVIDAAFAGRTHDVEAQYAKARGAGTAPGTIVSAALRHVGQMHKAKVAMEQGAGTDQAMRAFIPPLHFRREGVVGAALKSWAPSRLERTMTQLAEAVLETRRQASLADAIAQRTLLSIAVSARRRGD